MTTLFSLCEQASLSKSSVSFSDVLDVRHVIKKLLNSVTNHIGSYSYKVLI